MSTSEHDPFSSVGAEHMAMLTLRLLNDATLRGFFLDDPHMFALAYAACAGAIAPPEQLNELNVSKALIESGLNQEVLLGTLKDLQRQFGAQTSGRFAQLYLEGFGVQVASRGASDAFAEGISTWLAEAEQRYASGISSQEENITRLGRLLELTDVEQELLSFQLNRYVPGFAQLFDLLFAHSEAIVPLLLSRMLKSDVAAINDALSDEGSLPSYGLLGVQLHPLRIERPSEHLVSVINASADSDEEFFERFVKPLELSSSTSSLARLDDRDRAIFLKLMTTAIPDDHGINVLLYGPGSVDKRDLVARLLADEGIDAYRLVSKRVPGSDLPAWAAIAQRYLAQRDEDAILVVDRADQALAARQFSLAMLFGLDDSDPDDEGRLSDERLTSSRLRCVWLTSSPSFLTERNLGRFLFHAETLPGSRGDRRERIASVIGEFSLSDDLERELARYSFIGEQQVRNAARLAELLHSEPEEREKVILRAVAQSQRALGREQTEDLRDSVTNYSLDYLNLSGKFTPQQIVKFLRNKPHGSLCFYGIPGAGKTQLAEYLAVELDMPIIMKRASDLLSKWVGENEQNIAAMFREAENEGAILFLDEADSFLRDRALARAEWSVTQVNELLQQMERFKGIFIAATNLFQDLDAASLRRFTFKLEFQALTEQQAWNMLLSESGFDPERASEQETEQLRDALRQIPDLAPGDFATVKRQVLMLDETLTPQEWIAQLQDEAKLKMVGLKRHRLGFGS